MNWTPELTQLALAGFGLGCFVSYAWWCRIRAILFREDVFAIRDKLWDAAKERNAFEDGAYKETRETLNSCIQGATVISLPFILMTAAAAKKLPKQTKTNHPHSPIAAEIEAAQKDVARRIARYVIIHRPFSGGLMLVLILLMGAVVRKAAKPASNRPTDMAEVWVATRGPKTAAIAVRCAWPKALAS